MKTLRNIVFGIPIGALVIILFVLALPFFIIIIPFHWLGEKRFKKQYQQFLVTIEGKNFFCYNNRKKGRKYIEEQIIPYLPKEVEVIYLEGRKIESKKYEQKYLSRAFHEFKNYSRFPQLLKIRNGETIDCSINSEMFKSINGEKNISEVFDKVNTFFDLEN